MELDTKQIRSKLEIEKGTRVIFRMYKPDALTDDQFLMGLLLDFQKGMAQAVKDDGYRGAIFTNSAEAFVRLPPKDITPPWTNYFEALKLMREGHSPVNIVSRKDRKPIA